MTARLVTVVLAFASMGMAWHYAGQADVAHTVLACTIWLGCIIGLVADDKSLP